MALGIGYGLPFLPHFGSGADPYKPLWNEALEGAKAAGATVEDEGGTCLVARGSEEYNAGLPATPSLLIVPQFYKAGNLYQDVPPFVADDSTMKFAVTRATTATRVNSSGNIESVASGVPRIDWLASGGVVGCPALLVEASGSNGILNSTDTTTNWTLGTNLTSGAIDVIGVTGNNITIAVSGSGIGSAVGRFVRFSNNVALASGSTYTVSFLMKKTGAHTLGGYQLIMSSGVIGAGFDVSGSFTSGSNVDTAPTTNRIRRVEQWGTDVFRCSETFTMTAAATGTHLAFGPVSNVSVSTNSAVGTSMGFAAPQLELGAVPTTFIPTTTGSASRNADVISASGALVSGLIGATEGTIYAEVDIRRVNTSPMIVISDGSDTNRIQISFLSSTQLHATIRVAGANNNLTVTIPTIPSTGGIYKMALGYKANDYCFALNGTTYADTTSRSVPACNEIGLGTSATKSNFLNDRIRAALYTTRLTNDQLAQLTRL